MLTCVLRCLAARDNSTRSAQRRGRAAQVVWDIMRCWVAKNPVRITDKESYQAKILAVEPTIEVSFANAKGVMSKAKADRKARFVQNPENWGPRPKHGRPLLPHEREDGQAADGGDGGEEKGAKRQKR